MTKEEHMKKVIELKTLLQPHTLKYIHVIGKAFMGMTNMLISFTNGAALYIQPRVDDIPSASIAIGKSFIPNDSYEMMNAVFIDFKTMGKKLNTEEKTILKFLNTYLDDPGVERVQMVIDKGQDFLKDFYPNQSAYIFNKMTIIKR